MTREQIIDRLRAELARQRDRGNRFYYSPADKPDALLVSGVLDLHALAGAIADGDWR